MQIRQVSPIISHSTYLQAEEVCLFEPFLPLKDIPEGFSHAVGSAGSC